MSKLDQLAGLGQSIWYDYIRKAFLDSGELQALVDSGLRGVTSNPSIFEKAIAGSADYDDDLKALVAENKSVDEIYEALALADIGRAADIMLPVYQSTDKLDGYVSLEVSPTLAHDTIGTIADAKRLFAALGRPNVMIKVPATPAGLPVITELIGSGINVNVTLIFGNENYQAVAEAYILGLEKLVATGGDVSSVASVASFFISRVDTAVDNELAAKGNKSLQGKIAIANAKVAQFLAGEIFSGPHWEALAAAGAQVQRLLWASTGSKNPLYPDTIYVDELIGPATVNTVPPATFNAFLDHGTVATTLTEGVAEANAQVSELESLGIDLSQITQKLQDDGVKSFAQSFEVLMASIEGKRDGLLAGKKGYVATLHQFQSSVDEAVTELRDQSVMRRIWEHDHTVWKPDPTEISNRLGWLHSPEVMLESVDRIEALAVQVKAEGYTHMVLLGMGGSSLAPEVFRNTFGVKQGYLDLAVLDSTDPGAVLSYAEKHDPTKTLYIVSTKSGGTVETFSFFKYFFNQTLAAVGAAEAGRHFIAITDPGSKLTEVAAEHNFRDTFLNDPNIGGRYSALSFFGLVPAGLLGVDLKLLLERAGAMACNSEGCNCPVGGDNTSAWLGVTLGELTLAGRDKVTLVASPKLSFFGAWAEQLIAESTGKEGKGILPVDGEITGSREAYADDRVFVYLRLDGDSTFDAEIQTLIDAGQPVVQLNLKDPYDIGGEFFRWEVATILAGRSLRINPFDQPNVESAKILARKMVAEYHDTGKLPQFSPALQENDVQVFTDLSAENLQDSVTKFFAQADQGDKNGQSRSYVALQAYVQPGAETSEALQAFRQTVRDRFKVATTVGYGPRFLHSTGQLHKGDGGNGLFIQFTADMPRDIGIPDEAGSDASSMTFGVLKTSQALGDRQALIDGARHVIRFHLTGDVAGGIDKIRACIV